MGESSNLRPLSFIVSVLLVRRAARPSDTLNVGPPPEGGNLFLSLFSAALLPLNSGERQGPRPATGEGRPATGEGRPATQASGKARDRRCKRAARARLWPCPWMAKMIRTVRARLGARMHALQSAQPTSSRCAGHASPSNRTRAVRASSSVNVFPSAVSIPKAT